MKKYLWKFTVGILGFCLLTSFVVAQEKTDEKKTGSTVRFKIAKDEDKTAVKPDSNTNQKQEVKVESSKKSISDLQSQFAFRWYKNCAATQDKSNFVVSPFGIWDMLGSLYLGSQGDTHEQIQNVMGCGVTNTTYTSSMFEIFKKMRENSEIKFVSGIWYSPSLEISTKFQEMLGNITPVEFKAIDFKKSSSLGTINKWIEDRTNGRVIDFFSTLSPQNQLMLTNTVVFHGKWTKPFDKKLTLDTPFTSISGKETNCPVMRQTEKFRYYKNDSFQWLDLSYLDNKYSMIVVLPNKNTSFIDFEKNLNLEDLANANKNAKETKVEVLFPKFSILSDLDLSAIIKKMGMVDAFTPIANFKTMTEANTVMVSGISQGAYIDVNESGTEAIAVTEARMIPKSMKPIDYERFHATHPFFYYIKDNTNGIIVFAGRFTMPMENNQGK